ncbi:hypothetical protein PYW07_004964 [Mythimna separata]|uniref:Uncharacterized protein n=1 Tax=Mythimna separata TaxID=271217 RepID=A0AAD7YEE0_MYTSE|nr:hypothetical protein PYW07_004964 [Mythimna separata]
MSNGFRIKHSSLLLWTLLITSASSNKQKFISDASMISSLIEKIIKPYVESNQIVVGKPRQRAEDISIKPHKKSHQVIVGEPRYRADEDITIDPYIESNQIIVDKPRQSIEEDIIIKHTKTSVENAIKRNLIKLKPILQDDELNNNTKIDTDNSLKLEGNDETTIIELVPENNRKPNTRKTKELTDTFQRKIENYKQLRHNISKLLENVKTDSSTKMLITKTLDDMLTLLIERQCNLKHKDTNEVMNKLLTDARKSSIQKVGKKKERETISSQPQTVPEGYWAPFRGLEFHDETNGPRVVMADIKNFVYQILMNSWNVVDQYRVSCYLRYKDKPSEPSEHNDNTCTHSRCKMTAQPRAFARSLNGDSKSKDTQCDNWFVCTEELSAFLTKTYKSLNDTAVDTFRTYATMYMRDNKGENDIINENVVTNELEGLRVSAEIKVHKIFMEEMDQFTQEALKTKKDVNIQLVKNFIAGMISQIKSSLYKLVLEKLTKKAKLFSTVKDDLIVNLRMDLDNLNQEITDKICSSFELCNGKPNGNGTRRFNKRNPKDDVYVQLDISLDDQLKDSLASFSQQNMPSIESIKNISYGLGRLRYSYVSVTRTTVSSTVATQGSREQEQFF